MPRYLFQKLNYFFSWYKQYDTNWNVVLPIPFFSLLLLYSYSKRKCGIMSKCGHGQSNQDTQEEISIYQKPCLSMEQKLDIARQFSHELTQELSSKKLNSQRSIQNLKILLDETEMRIADLQRDARDFKKEIVVEGENELTGRTMAEKVVRYMDGKLQHKEIMIEKYRLKSTILKAQKRKLEMQLKEKEKGGTLHYIDFHQVRAHKRTRRKCQCVKI